MRSFPIIQKIENLFILLPFLLLVSNCIEFKENPTLKLKANIQGRTLRWKVSPADPWYSFDFPEFRLSPSVQWQRRQYRMWRMKSYALDESKKLLSKPTFYNKPVTNSLMQRKFISPWELWKMEIKAILRQEEMNKTLTWLLLWPTPVRKCCMPSDVKSIGQALWQTLQPCFHLHLFFRLLLLGNMLETP